MDVVLQPTEALEDILENKGLDELRIRQLDSDTKLDSARKAEHGGHLVFGTLIGAALGLPVAIVGAIPGGYIGNRIGNWLGKRASAKAEKRQLEHLRLGDSRFNNAYGSIVSRVVSANGIIADHDDFVHLTPSETNGFCLDFARAGFETENLDAVVQARNILRRNPTDDATAIFDEYVTSYMHDGTTLDLEKVRGVVRAGIKLTEEMLTKTVRSSMRYIGLGEEDEDFKFGLHLALTKDVSDLTLAHAYGAIENRGKDRDHLSDLESLAKKMEGDLGLKYRAGVEGKYMNRAQRATEVDQILVWVQRALNVYEDRPDERRKSKKRATDVVFSKARDLGRSGDIIKAMELIERNDLFPGYSKVRHAEALIEMGTELADHSARLSLANKAAALYGNGKRDLQSAAYEELRIDKIATPAILRSELTS